MRLAVTQNDVVAMEAFLQEMRKPPEDYEGTLLQQERMTWAAKLESELALEIASASFFAEEYKKLANMPASNMSAYLGVMRKMASQNPQAALVYDRMKESGEAIIRERKTDSASFAIKSGLTKPVFFDPQDPSGALQQLNANDEIVLGTYGTSTGIFTEEQAQTYSKYLEELPQDQLAPAFATIEAAMPGQSHKIYEQLKAEGLSDILPIAGQRYADGDVDQRYHGDRRLGLLV